MSKLLKNVIISVASGAVTAHSLPIEKDKEFQKKAAKAYEAHKEDPAEHYQKARDKAIEYTDLVVDTSNDYRQKLEPSELTTDESLDIAKEKGKAAADFVSEKVSEFASKISEVVNEAEEAKEETKVEADDIIIDYTQDGEAPATERPETTTEEIDEE